MAKIVKFYGVSMAIQDISHISEISKGKRNNYEFAVYIKDGKKHHYFSSDDAEKIVSDRNTLVTIKNSGK